MMLYWQSKFGDFYTTKIPFSIGFLNQGSFLIALLWRPLNLPLDPMLGKASCEEGMSLKGVLGGVYDVEILLVFGWTLGFHLLIILIFNLQW